MQPRCRKNVAVSYERHAGRDKNPDGALGGKWIRGVNLRTFVTGLAVWRERGEEPVNERGPAWAASARNNPRDIRTRVSSVTFRVRDDRVMHAHVQGHLQGSKRSCARSSSCISLLSLCFCDCRNFVISDSTRTRRVRNARARARQLLKSLANRSANRDTYMMNVR